jgi:hypothetical protein
VCPENKLERWTTSEFQSGRNPDVPCSDYYRTPSNAETTQRQTVEPCTGRDVEGNDNDLGRLRKITEILRTAGVRIHIEPDTGT